MIKDVLAFLTILALGGGLYYEHYYVVADLEKEHRLQIELLEKERDDAKEELAVSRNDFQKLLATARASLAVGESEVVSVTPDTSALEAQRDMAAELAQKKRVAEAAAAAAEERKQQEELRKRERTMAIQEIDAEIARGKAAERLAKYEKPPFKELSPNGSGVRTSDADRQRWYKQRDARLKAIQAKLAELQAQKKAL